MRLAEALDDGGELSPLLRLTAEQLRHVLTFIQ
jgi:hypothetical protein